MSSQQLKYVRVAIIDLILIFLLLTSSLLMGQVAPNLPYRFMPLQTLKPPTSTLKPSGEAQEVRKTKGFKLIAMVFYGRRQYVEILDCYLKRNLAENGGLIDEVHFMANTARRGDLQYLDYLLTTSKSYVKIKPRKLNLFDEMWAHATDKDSMYIKIDDDIVYIHNDAIPRLVNTLIQHPEAHLVSANLINSALSNWQHFHTDAILPYLPEPTPPMKSPHSKNLTSWRASELPAYPTVPDSPWYFPEVPFGGLDIGAPGGPPFQGHRWLPLPPDAKSLLQTPIFGAVYDAEMGIHHQWAIAAQEHYSFLENLENNQLTKYWTGNREGIWNLQYQRHNLNFVAIWGSSVANDLPGQQDEIDLFLTIPKRIGKPAIIDTHAIVSHFTFWPQARELLTTDLLERYKMYAEETVCKKI